jgi:hypothetical protein
MKRFAREGPVAEVKRMTLRSPAKVTLQHIPPEETKQ